MSEQFDRCEGCFYFNPHVLEEHCSHDPDTWDAETCYIVAAPCPWDETYLCEFYPRDQGGCDEELCELMEDRLNNSSNQTKIKEEE